MTQPKPLLADRLVEVGGRVCALVRRGPREQALDAIHGPLVGCATAPAANYAEARDSVSTRDYIYRMKICVKELRETLTWLQMTHRAGYRSPEIEALVKECNELIAIAESHHHPPKVDTQAASPLLSPLSTLTSLRSPLPLPLAPRS